MTPGEAVVAGSDYLVIGRPITAADDPTAEVVGGFAGRAMVLDPALEERIMAILRRNRGRWRSYSDEALREPNAIQPACIEAMKVTAAQKIDLFDAAGKASLY